MVCVSFLLRCMFGLKLSSLCVVLMCVYEFWMLFVCGGR